MKNFTLENMGVVSLNEQELLTIEGGSFFSNLVDAVNNFLIQVALEFWFDHLME